MRELWETPRRGPRTQKAPHHPGEKPVRRQGPSRARRARGQHGAFWTTTETLQVLGKHPPPPAPMSECSRNLLTGLKAEERESRENDPPHHTEAGGLPPGDLRAGPNFLPRSYSFTAGDQRGRGYRHFPAAPALSPSRTRPPLQF